MNVYPKRFADQWLADAFLRAGIFSYPQWKFHGSPERSIRWFQDLLLQQGLLSPTEMNRLVSRYLGLPTIQPDKVSLDVQLLSQFPQGLCSREGFLPLQLVRGQLILASCAPLRPDVAREIEFRTASFLRPFFAPRLVLLRTLKAHYQALRWAREQMIFRRGQQVALPQVLPEMARWLWEKARQNFEIILTRTSGSRAFCIALDSIPGSPRTLEAPALLWDSLLRELIRQAGLPENLVQQSARLSGTFPIRGKIGQGKIHLQHSPAEQRITMRLNPSETRLREEQIALYQRELRRFDALWRKNAAGLIVVSGKAGQSVGQILSWMKQQLLQSEREILSLEEELECPMDGITQIRLDRDSPFQTLTYLRSTLAAQADVLLVDPVREKVVLGELIHLAVRGKLVVCAIREETLPAVLTWLQNNAPVFGLLKRVLKLVVVQHLVPRRCPHCTSVEGLLADPFAEQSSSQNQNGGCLHCDFTGWLDWIPLMESLLFDEQCRQRWKNNEPPEQWLEKTSSYRSIFSHAKTLVQEGLLTWPEILQWLPQKEVSRQQAAVPGENLSAPTTPEKERFLRLTSLNKGSPSKRKDIPLNKSEVKP